MYSFSYLVLIMCYLALGIFETIYPNYKRKFQLLECVLFIFFFGFRGYIGTDWFNYRNFYLSIDTTPWHYQYEPGFTVLANLCKILGLDFHAWVFVIVLIQGILFDYYFSKKVRYTYISYIILISAFPVLIIDTLRNFISILLGLCALDFWKKNKIRAVILLLCSISFHSTGILFFLLLLISKSYFNKKIVFALFIIGLVVYFLRIQFVTPILKLIGSLLGGGYELMVNTYLENGFSKPYNISVGIVEKIIFFLLVMYKYNYIIKSKIIEAQIFNLFILYILSQFYLTEMNILINRAAILFFGGYITILASLPSLYNIQFNKVLISLMIIILSLIKTNISYNTAIYDYTNVLFEQDDINIRMYNISKHYNL